MSYIDKDLDLESRNDPRRDMPGVLAVRLETYQLNTVHFRSVDQRTAQVAIVSQGLDPSLAGQLMTTRQQALQSEANAPHSEVRGKC